MVLKYWRYEKISLKKQEKEVEKTKNKI